jgi:hypothetical protein
MAKLPKPFVVTKRTDSKTFRLTINLTSGLPERVCAGWRRVSFQDLPDELAQYRAPKTKSATEAGAMALIAYLKKNLRKVLRIGSVSRILQTAPGLGSLPPLKPAPGQVLMLPGTGPIPQLPWKTTGAIIIPTSRGIHLPC